MSGVSGVREHAILELIRSRASIGEGGNEGHGVPSASGGIGSTGSGAPSAGGMEALAPGDAESLALPRTLREL